MNKAYFSTNHSADLKLLSNALASKIRKALDRHDLLVFLSIGSDRSTGDSLGPFVGEKIKSLQGPFVKVIGTLESPIHAKNLESCLSSLPALSTKPFVIAIDACLGKKENVGAIILKDGPIFPGSGVKKSLPPAGDISLAGIVNHSSESDFLSLQNTRLFRVWQMANFVGDAIISATKEVIYDKKVYSRNFK